MVSCYRVGMTQQELIASLTAVHADSGIDFGDDKYIDWSSRLGNGAYIFEAGDGTDTTQLWLTRSDLLRLHAALTLTLLRDGE
jgi:hypothetical protein